MILESRQMRTFRAVKPDSSQLRRPCVAPPPTDSDGCIMHGLEKNPVHGRDGTVNELSGHIGRRDQRLELQLGCSGYSNCTSGEVAMLIHGLKTQGNKGGMVSRILLYRIHIHCTVLQCSMSNCDLILVEQRLTVSSLLRRLPERHWGAQELQQVYA